MTWSAKFSSEDSSEPFTRVFFPLMKGIFSLEIGEFSLWRTVGLCEIMFLRCDRLSQLGHDVCWSCLLFSGEEIEPVD